MFKFYTAIGQLYLVRDKDGNKQPIIKWDNRVFELDKNELIVWSSLMWHISEYDELFEVFKEKISKEYLDIDITIIKIDFNRTLDRLVNRNIVAVSEDKVDIASVYKLIADLTIKPSTANLFVSTIAFLKFVFIDKILFINAIKVFSKNNLSKNERKILNVIKKDAFNTNELMSVVNLECGKQNYDFSSIDKNVFENNERLASAYITMQTVCSLYLKKFIQFE